MHRAPADADVEPDDELDAEYSAFDRGLLAGAAEVYRAVLPLLAAPLEGASRRVRGAGPHAPATGNRVRGRHKGAK